LIFPKSLYILEYTFLVLYDLLQKYQENEKEKKRKKNKRKGRKRKREEKLKKEGDGIRLPVFNFKNLENLHLSP
jgi:hypothetical protein